MIRKIRCISLGSGSATEVAQPSADLHQPGQAQVGDETAENAACAHGDHAQDHASEERGDAFSQRLAEMDGAIEDGHGKDGFLSCIAGQSYDQQSPEEKLDGKEVQALG